MLVDKKGNYVKSSYTRDDLEILSQEGKGFKVEQRQYSGCPSFSFDKDQDLL